MTKERINSVKNFSNTYQAFHKMLQFILIGISFIFTNNIICQVDASRPVGSTPYLEVDAYYDTGAQTNTDTYNRSNLHNGLEATVRALHVDKRNHEMITANMHNTPLITTNVGVSDINNLNPYLTSISANPNNIPFIITNSASYSEYTVAGAVAFGLTGANDSRITAHGIGHMLANNGHDSHVNFADYHADKTSNGGSANQLHPNRSSIMDTGSGDMRLFSTDSTNVVTENDGLYHWIQKDGYPAWIEPGQLDNRRAVETLTNDPNTNTQNRIWLDANTSFVKTLVAASMPVITASLNGNQLGIDSLSKYKLGERVFYTIHDTTGAIDSTYFIDHNQYAYLYDENGSIIAGPQHVDSSFTITTDGIYIIGVYDKTTNQLSDTANINSSVEVDNTLPTQSTLSANNETHNTIDLSWTPSTDANGIFEYQVYQDGSQIASVSSSTTTYQAIGLSPLTSYNFQIIAVDNSSSLNESPSSIVSATTLATPDNTNPTVNKLDGDTTVLELDQNGEASLNFTDFATATDASGINAISISQEDFYCVDEGQIIPVDYTVVDNSTNPGPNETTGTQYIKVEENLAPNLIVKTALTFSVPTGTLFPILVGLPTEIELLEDLVISNNDNCDTDPVLSITYPTSLQAGLNTVGIKSADDNGNETIKESTVTVTETEPNSILDIGNYKGFKVYPNPTNGFLIIESGENNISDLSIQSVTGQEMMSSNTKIEKAEMITLDINHLPKGIYSLKTVNDKGETMVSKVIKN